MAWVSSSCVVLKINCFWFMWFRNVNSCNQASMNYLPWRVSICELWHQVIPCNALTRRWKAVKSRRFHHTVEEVCKLWLTKNGSRTLFPVCARRKKVTHPNKFRDSNIWTFPKDVLLVDISASIQYPQDSSIVQPNRVTTPYSIGMVRIYRSLTTCWYKLVYFCFSCANRKPSVAANFCALKFTNLLYSLVKSPYLCNL